MPVYTRVLATVDWIDDILLLRDIRVYMLAGMFDLPDLEALCKFKLEKRLNSDWSIEDFAECVQEVYKCTDDDDPQSLRHLVVKLATQHADDLTNESSFIDLLYEGGDFAIDFPRSCILGDIIICGQ
jgi:hypothetical protein